MRKQSKKDIIKHWAEFVIPAVFWAETELLKNEPEWVERVKDAPDEEKEELAQDYCTAIAHIILREPIKKDKNYEKERRGGSGSTAAQDE